MDFKEINNAVEFLSRLDIIEMANHVVTQAQLKGPKEAFNEAGNGRYQLAKARQQYEFLKESICKDSLEQMNAKIEQLKRANERKRQIVGNEQS